MSDEYKQGWDDAIQLLKDEYVIKRKPTPLTLSQALFPFAALGVFGVLLYFALSLEARGITHFREWILS